MRVGNGQKRLVWALGPKQPKSGTTQGTYCIYSNILRSRQRLRSVAQIFFISVFTHWNIHKNSSSIFNSKSAIGNQEKTRIRTKVSQIELIHGSLWRSCTLSGLWFTISRRKIRRSKRSSSLMYGGVHGSRSNALESQDSWVIQRQIS